MKRERKEGRKRERKKKREREKGRKEERIEGREKGRKEGRKRERRRKEIKKERKEGKKEKLDQSVTVFVLKILSYDFIELFKAAPSNVTRMHYDHCLSGLVAILLGLLNKIKSNRME